MATSEVSSPRSIGLAALGLAFLAFRSLIQTDLVFSLTFGAFALVIGAYASRRTTGWGRVAGLAGAALGTLSILGLVVTMVLLSLHIDPYTGQRLR